MLRLWLTWSAWLVREDELLDRFETALSILDEHGLKAMPVLFNRWNDAQYPAGMVTDQDLLQSDFRFAKFDAYVDALGRRFGADPRIGIWDLCNEPQAPRGQGEVPLREAIWLTTVADRLRRHTDTPLTVGTMSGEQRPPLRPVRRYPLVPPLPTPAMARWTPPARTPRTGRDVRQAVAGHGDLFAAHWTTASAATGAGEYHHPGVSRHRLAGLAIGRRQVYHRQPRANRQQCRPSGRRVHAVCARRRVDPAVPRVAGALSYRAAATVSLGGGSGTGSWLTMTGCWRRSSC